MSDQALYKIAEILPKDSHVLDIGAGRKPRHANYLRKRGLKVDTVDFHDNATYLGDYNQIDLPVQYDCVWSSHCLEHQLNVNRFLSKCHKDTKEGGYMVVTVPPLKHTIVSGHVSLWNAGLVLYNLVLAGFDCSNAMIKSYDYNVSVIVKKKSFEMPKLNFDQPDLQTLNQYFPKGLKYGPLGEFEGQIRSHNWD